MTAEERLNEIPTFIPHILGPLIHKRRIELDMERRVLGVRLITAIVLDTIKDRPNS